MSKIDYLYCRKSLDFSSYQNGSGNGFCRVPTSSSDYYGYGNGFEYDYKLFKRRTYCFGIVRGGIKEEYREEKKRLKTKVITGHNGSGNGNFAYLSGFYTINIKVTNYSTDIKLSDDRRIYD